MRARIGRDVSKEDAHKRAIEDSSQFSQYARTSAQFAFAGNGGAAAAILSFLTAITNSATKNSAIDTNVIVRSFAIASSCYLAGLFFSMVAMFPFYRAKQNWGNAWENTAFTGRMDFDSGFALAGARARSNG